MTTREKKDWYFGSLLEWAARCGSLTDGWLRLRTWEHLSHEKAEDAHLQRQLNTHMKKQRWYLKRRKLLPLHLPFHFSGGLAHLPSWSLGSVRPLQPHFLHPLLIWSQICHFSFFVIRVSEPKPAVTLRRLDMEPLGEQGPFAQSLDLMTVFILLRRAAATSSPSRLESTLGRWGLDSNFLFC